MTQYDPNKIDLPGLQLLGPRQEKFSRIGARTGLSRDERCSFANRLLRRGAHARRTQQSASGGPRLQRLAADTQSPCAVAHSSRLGGASLWRSAPCCGREARHQRARRRPLRFYRPGFGEHDLRSLVASADEQPGPNPVPASPLRGPVIKDGLGNKISMAYANPEDRSDERKWPTGGIAVQ